MEFFKNSFARIFYDKELNTLFLEYISKVPSDEQFIVVNTAVLDAFRKLETQKFVADIRKMGIISISSQNWVVQNLLPGMLKHLKGKKLYHAQFLDASEVMSKVSAGNIKSKSQKVAADFEVVQCTSDKELQDYLNSIK